MVLAPLREPKSASSQSHVLDLRLVNLKNSRREVRLDAALDIIHEGDLDKINLCIVPLLIDRSIMVRQHVYHAIVMLTFMWFPPFMDAARREIRNLKERSSN